MSDFQLHPQLQQDCYLVEQLPLCQLLMMNDSQFPWFILVPTRQGIREIYQLNPTDRRMLLDESCLLAETLQTLYMPDKLNIAAIGNLVPQLHIHHVVRYQADKAWPAPIWGKFPAERFLPAQAELEMARVREGIKAYLQDKND